MGFSLTQFSLQSVVSFGSSRRGGASGAVEPVNCTRAAVPTALAFKGTHPRHLARTVQERHIVNGHAPIKTRANRFKHQLVVGQRQERVSWKGRKIMFKYFWYYLLISLFDNKNYPEVLKAAVIFYFTTRRQKFSKNPKPPNLILFNPDCVFSLIFLFFFETLVMSG